MTDFLVVNNNKKKLIISFQGFDTHALVYSLPLNYYLHDRLINNKEYNYLFIKDNKQMWYFYDYKTTLKKIQDHITEHDYDFIKIVGSSSGGYASILFGHHLNYDPNKIKIIAFVPQIQIELNIHYPHRKNMIKPEDFEKYHDLSVFQPFSKKITIHYGCLNPEDQTHMSKLNVSDENLKIVKHNTSDHNIVSLIGKDKYYELILNDT